MRGGRRIARPPELGERHPFTAFGLHNLATYLRYAGRLEEARPLYEEALSIRTETIGSVHPDTARTLGELTRLHADLGELDRAWERSSEGLAASRGQIERVFWSLTETERLLYADRFEIGLETHLSLARRRGGADAWNAAYEYILDWKGQVSRSLLGSRARFLQSLSAEERQKLDRLDAVQTELGKLFYEKGSEDPGELEFRLEELRDERAQLERELVRAAGKGASASSASLSEVRKALPEGAVIVDFLVHRWYEEASEDEKKDGSRALGAWSEPHLSAWIVQRDPKLPVVHVDLGPEEDIRKTTASFLKTLVKTRGVATVSEVEDPSQEIREALWDPIASSIGASELVSH